MAKRQSAKQSSGQRNDARKSGKKWKKNLSPEARAQIARDKAAAKKARKAASE